MVRAETQRRKAESEISRPSNIPARPFSSPLFLTNGVLELQVQAGSEYVAHGARPRIEFFFSAPLRLGASPAWIIRSRGRDDANRPSKSDPDPSCESCSSCLLFVAWAFSLLPSPAARNAGKQSRLTFPPRCRRAAPTESASVHPLASYRPHGPHETFRRRILLQPSPHQSQSFDHGLHGFH
jgi:hypothetical protein